MHAFRVVRLVLAFVFMAAGVWDGTLCPSTGESMAVSSRPESDCAGMSMAKETPSPKSQSGHDRSHSGIWPTCCVGHVISVGRIGLPLTLAARTERQQVGNIAIKLYVSPMLIPDPPPPKG
jgi:hypothetical protein